MQKKNPEKKVVAKQSQERPGLELKMIPTPVFY
jgi:hypothetical protein